MTIKLLTEHHLEFLALKGGCTGSSESTLVKMPHCWKSHVAAHLFSTHSWHRILINLRSISNLVKWPVPCSLELSYGVVPLSPEP